MSAPLQATLHYLQPLSASAAHDSPNSAQCRRMKILILDGELPLGHGDRAHRQQTKQTFRLGPTAPASLPPAILLLPRRCLRSHWAVLRLKTWARRDRIGSDCNVLKVRNTRVRVTVIVNIRKFDLIICYIAQPFSCKCQEFNIIFTFLFE